MAAVMSECKGLEIILHRYVADRNLCHKNNHRVAVLVSQGIQFVLLIL